jgi:hypothetical protein
VCYKSQPFHTALGHGLLSCYLIFMLKIEAVRSSEMLVSYHITTWHHNLEECSVNLHHYENLTSLILLDLIILTLLGAEHRLRNSSCCNFPHLSVTLSFLGPCILHSTLFSDVLIIYSSLREFLLYHTDLLLHTCRVHYIVAVFPVYLYTRI